MVFVPVTEKGECDTNGRVMNGERDKGALFLRVERDNAILDGDGWPTKVLEGGNHSHRSAVANIAVVIEDVEISADHPNAHTGIDAQFFSVHRATLAHSALNHSRNMNQIVTRAKMKAT